MQVVQNFIGLWNANSIEAAHNMLSETVVYHNIPMEPIHGRAAALAASKQYGIGEKLLANWEILHIAENAEIVLTERLDKFKTHDGRDMAIRVMGTFKVVNGEITEWRDYFDMGELQRELAKVS